MIEGFHPLADEPREFDYELLGRVVTKKDGSTPEDGVIVAAGRLDEVVDGALSENVRVFWYNDKDDDAISVTWEKIGDLLCSNATSDLEEYRSKL